MKNKSNKNLFWYGVMAKIKIFFGSLLIFIGLITLAFELIVGIILIILGAVLIFLGKQQRFDYKMQSGTMIHRGDW